jgi:hypothetical protein
VRRAEGLRNADSRQAATLCEGSRGLVFCSPRVRGLTSGYTPTSLRDCRAVPDTQPNFPSAAADDNFPGHILAAFFAVEFAVIGERACLIELVLELVSLFEHIGFE